MSRYGPQVAALERRAERERATLERWIETGRRVEDGPTALDGPGDDGPSAFERQDDDGPTVLDGPSAGDRIGAIPDEPTIYLREGAGQAIWLYVRARTGGRLVPVSAAELDALTRAMNAWLECYARWHGVDLEAAFSIREAAELLLQTRNVVDVAQLLTGVPGRQDERRAEPEDARTPK